MYIVVVLNQGRGHEVAKQSHKPKYAVSIGSVDGTPAVYCYGTMHKVSKPYTEALSVLARWMSENNIPQSDYSSPPSREVEPKKNVKNAYGAAQKRLF